MFLVFMCFIATSRMVLDHQFESLIDRHDISSPATPKCQDCGQPGHVDCKGELYDIGFGITVGFTRDLDEIMESDREHFVPYHTWP